MTNEQQAAISKYQDTDGSIPNIDTTLIKNYAMFSTWSTFESYLKTSSSLTARDRELILLRVSWLCNSEYLYGLRVESAKTTGLTDADILLILEGPNATGLKESDKTLLTAVDELYYDAFITDSSWTSLSASYTENQLIDLILTTGEGMIESWVINSINIQKDDGLEAFPDGVTRKIDSKTLYTDGSTRTRLTTPRLTPLKEEDWPAGTTTILLNYVKSMYGFNLNIFTTLARNSKSLDAWLAFAKYMLDSSLPAKDRELSMLRIGWLCYSEYEFGQHAYISEQENLWTSSDLIYMIEGPDTTGFQSSSIYPTLLAAVDELYIDNAISDATWNTINKTYSENQLIDLVFTIGEYNLVSMVLNSLGVQLEDAFSEYGFPEGY